ncbi:MAG: WD40 repeat domain-containing protein [Leptospirales bacterium]|nr:WD40 repeat domain-containing protein [Leptospirales bacterium]
MRKAITLLFIFSATLLAQSAGLRFPRVERLEDNKVDAAGAWKIVRRVQPQIQDQNIYSFKYHPDGKSVIIGTTDFAIFRISLEDGRMLWKADAKMMYQKEFDGPEIFDVSADGKIFLSTGQSNPEVQASERYLVIRSCANGSIVGRFPVEISSFYSVSAAMDHRYSASEEAERRETGLGFPWIMTISAATFAENGSRIVASYQGNMTGQHFYDKRIVVYNTAAKAKLSEMQLVADPKTAVWDQPAGFEIAHMQFPYLYNPKNKSILFGTSHGRIHEISSSEMASNAKTALVEDKTAGKVLFTPLSTSSDMAVKDRQTLRYMAFSPDGKTVFASAGTEGGYIQLYAFDYASRKEVFHSTLFDAGRLQAPSGDILVIGGIFSSGKFMIADVRKGTLVFASQGEETVSPAIFDSNPTFREVAALGSGGAIVLIRPDQSETRW